MVPPSSPFASKNIGGRGQTPETQGDKARQGPPAWNVGLGETFQGHCDASQCSGRCPCGSSSVLLLQTGVGGSVEVSACTPLEREGLVYVPWQPGHPG